MAVERLEGTDSCRLEEDDVRRDTSVRGKHMSEKNDEESKIEAAKERLRRFGKPASQCKGHHDPERFAAAKQGRKFVPRSVWAELGRKFQII
jgi:hypothetical protein